MSINSTEVSIDFYELPWDTKYFGVSCAKAILYKPVSKSEWDELVSKFNNYQFISIENHNSEISNAMMIASDTKAFLADIRIILVKQLTGIEKIPDSVKLYDAMPYDERIIKMADYPSSKFVGDPMLNERGGADVYREWLSNSFGKPGKIFAMNEGEHGALNGYLLFSFPNGICFPELMNVDDNSTNKGTGISLFNTMASVAYQRGCTEITAGTPLKNYKAINLYHKLGYKQTACHEIYHLWNI